MTARRNSAFTLVELIVVLGIVTALAMALGWGLSARPANDAVRAGRQMVASLVATAQLRVGVRGGRCALVIDADPAHETFLRQAWVVVEGDTGQWTALDEGALLPAGVGLVPGAEFHDLSVLGSEWGDVNRSSLRPLNADESVGGVNEMAVTFISEPAFSADHTGAGTRWVVAPLRRIPAGWRFGAPSEARGVVLGVYGVTLIDDDTTNAGP